jgi:hypothetical protein
MLYHNHSHPIVAAGMITSRALTMVERDRFRATNQADRKKALNAIERSERIHNYIAGIIKNTPDAWVECA